MSSSQKNTYTGIGLAVLAVIIWSGNFIAAKGVIKQIPPVSLAFYRWSAASLLIFPFAIRSFVPGQGTIGWKMLKQSFHYLFWVSLTGIAIFNTFVYIGAHYTTAINLSLIGTTTSPVIAVLLARIFLKEKIGGWKITGITLCICGVLFLLSKGDFQNLLHLRFTPGDGWILMAALSFAVYNTLVRKKPTVIDPPSFLFIIFSFGTVLLLPFYLWEAFHTPSIEWDGQLVLIILFLGLGASVISFLCWNMAVAKLGAGRTALFGNLIPIFTSIQATILLNEKFSSIHIISMGLVFAGILLANWKILR